MQKASDRYPKTIYVDGSELSNGRYQVTIDNVPVALRPVSFKLFSLLSWHCRFGSPAHCGWIYNLELDPFDHTARYLFRLRTEIQPVIGWLWRVYENNYVGYYRLYARPKSITLNLDNLKVFPDSAVSALVSTVS